VGAPVRITLPLEEGETTVYENDLVDRDGNAIAPASLASLALTLYVTEIADDPDNPAANIVNFRQAMNVLNANGVTLDGAGHLVWTTAAADAAVIQRWRETQKLRAVFAWVDTTGKPGAHEVDLRVTKRRR
jgi:hypothetical protein